VVRPPVRNQSQKALAEVLSGGADAGSLIRAPDGGAPRILVGEPDPGVRDRLHRVLGSAGCRVEAADDGRAAFAAAIRDPPDLMIVDAGVPRRHGFAMLRQLRADPATRWLPVIMLSADPAESAKREALDAGADDCLVKPFGARDLLSRVGLHLAMARVGREAAEAVRASERRLAEVLEAIGEAVYAMDRDLHILFANPKALELWQKPPAEVIGQHLLDAFPGIDKGEPYRAYRRVLATAEPAHLEARAPALGDRWIGLDVYPGPDGGLVVAFRDIDERKSAEARLRDSQERFRLMLEALPDKAFVIGPDGRTDYYNQQLRDYAGALIGPDPTDRSSLYPAEDRERVDRARAHSFATGEEMIVEARMRRHDGANRWHRIRNRPVLIDGKIAFWLGTAVDIDDMREANALLERRVAERTSELEAANRRLASQIEEREKAEAQLRQAQRIEAVGQLTSGVAHDFNNLLTAIIGNLELIEARLGAGNERIARPLAAASAAAERGARLTAQLLAFSRQQRMSPEPVDLNLIVGSLGGMLQSTIGPTTRIETELASDPWPALADATQMELVLLNLAINARDAMPGGGAITVATGNVTLGAPERPEHPPPGEYAMVAVADTGTGIPAAILDKVFDPFFTTKDIGRGSGLGLSQVLGVAQQLGGGVRIDTQPAQQHEAAPVLDLPADFLDHRAQRRHLEMLALQPVEPYPGRVDAPHRSSDVAQLRRVEIDRVIRRRAEIGDGPGARMPDRRGKDRRRRPLAVSRCNRLKACCHCSGLPLFRRIRTAEIVPVQPGHSHLIHRSRAMPHQVSSRLFFPRGGTAYPRAATAALIARPAPSGALSGGPDENRSLCLCTGRRVAIRRD
jgi:PAS domain S-box-containing protein